MKKSADEMAGQIRKWTAEGMDDREISIRVAAWMGSDSDEEAELEAEMLQAEADLWWNESQRKVRAEIEKELKRQTGPTTSSGVPVVARKNREKRGQR